MLGEEKVRAILILKAINGNYYSEIFYNFYCIFYIIYYNIVIIVYYLSF